MSRSTMTGPALGAAALLGGGVYMMRGSKSKNQDATNDPAGVARKKEQADAKRDLGLGGAGVGGNTNTGGTELGSGLASGNTGENQGRWRQASGRDVPRENLPSGGVGGGYGGNNANTRAVEHTKGSSTGGGSGAGENKTQGVGEMLQGALGSKGSRENEQDRGHEGGPGGRGRPEGAQGIDRQDTKVWSHYGESPTKRGGGPFDKHRKDVTASGVNPDR
ncbi:hypothetical protein SODALDRAFT_328564 [Sodiomyces alkalinus F11]|uniref:Uncharacterized protein n=1 Tax=Sodiomyces alkalinus (strain CBS 110278 / VKM F-3762 / F11) TaxID=1314773 RepID=A0A3N2PLM3_SODAK|nr:hypothetical protein SODALDRAFT_328564 [Sodiomyces alkalinus F11]ROT35246.1 hypothetical protein SODALDRAFT_328564 [Sodiomyces alkalinus F11]